MARKRPNCRKQMAAVALNEANEQPRREVTERKHAEDALLVERQRLFSLLDALPAFVTLQEPDHSIRFVNRYFRDRFGDPKTKSCPKNFCNAGEHRERCPTFRTYQTKAPQEWEWSDAPDVRMYHVSSHPFIDADGSALVLELGVDITDLKRSEDALKESQSQQRAVLDTIPDIAWLKDKESRFIMVNEPFGRACGMKPEELTGMTDRDIWPPGLAERYRADDREVMNTGRRKCVEEPLVPREGEEKWIETIKTPTRNQAGEVMGTVGIARDITERKQAEDALRESEERFRKVFEDGSFGMAFIDLNNRFIKVNAMLCRMLGYAEEELLGLAFSDITHPDDIEKDVELAARLFRGDIPLYKTEKRYITRSRETIWIHLTASIIRDKEGTFLYALGIFEDITNRRKLEEALVRARKLEAMGVLAGGIAHDFNNLLSIILGNINLVQMRSKPDGPLLSSLAAMEQAALRTSELIRKFITFSSGGMPVKSAVSIEELVRDSTTLALSGSKVRCEYSFDGDLWRIEADRMQMSQAIYNVTVNAKESMPLGGTVKVIGENVEVVSGDERGLGMKPSRYVKISIIDHGVGISEEDLGRVFDPYFSLKERGIDKGMGLGLSIAHSIVQKHDGVIHVESRVKAGTAFHIYLPAHDA